VGSPKIVWCDREKIEKVISNLVSNALKYTGKNGKVLIVIQEQEHPQFTDGIVEVSVIDNGIGINPENLKRIFDYFERSDSSDVRKEKGYGIGLALVKEFIKLHRGSISVVSTPHQGSTFTFFIPIGTQHFTDNSIALEPSHETAEQIVGQASDFADKLSNENRIKPLVMIVDDNADIRLYLKDLLAPHYRLEVAENAHEALKKITSKMPDIIISDNMMPGMTGFEFCKKIKTDLATSHIPVIMLTVKSSEEDRISGLEAGADSYIPKPFNAKHLLVRIEKLLERKQKTQEYYKNPINLFAGGVDSQQPTWNDIFVQKAKEVVEKNLTNSQLSVEMLSQELTMSRSNLHLKFKLILNQTPNDFIRHIRLNYAASLLAQKRYTIEEISYMSGFSSPSYFTKCFKEHYSLLPSEFHLSLVN